LRNFIETLVLLFAVLAAGGLILWLAGSVLVVFLWAYFLFFRSVIEFLRELVARIARLIRSR
jgi:hypothetical protein